LENSTKDYSHGWIVKGGQKYFTTHNEKSARDKNFKAESSETIEVGHTNDRKEKRRAARTWENRATARCNSLWFDEPTNEIPPNQSWFG